MLPQPPPSRKEARSGRSTFQLCTALNIVLLFVILILIARTVLLPQSLIYDAHLARTEELKRLVQETAKLLNDLSEANIELPGQVQADIKNIRSDFPPSQGVSKNPEEARDTGILLEKSNFLFGSSSSVSNMKMLISRLENELQNCTSSQKPIEEFKDVRLSKKWLVIGITTVARPNNEDYLIQTLTAMSEQLPSDPDDLLYNQILVLVVNVQSQEINPNPHQRFQEAQMLFAPESGNPKSIYFKFIEARQDEVSLSLDLAKHTNGPDLGSANVPGRMVRKQTRDISLVLSKAVGLGRYYLFLEDDMKFCRQGLSAIQYLLDKASRYHPNWLAIRASYGMNGIFMHDKDLLVFADYLKRNQVRRPPDHLVVEWFAGETPESKEYKASRANIGFRYNLFDHLGVSSSLRKEKQSSFPRCYDQLLEPTVFEVEAFSVKQCGNDDIWPCKHIPELSRYHLNLQTLYQKEKRK